MSEPDVVVEVEEAMVGSWEVSWVRRWFIKMELGVLCMVLKEKRVGKA